MEDYAGIQIENAAKLSELDRLEAGFKQITNSSIEHLQNELELAKAMADDEKVKLYHIQIGMYRHAQTIFEVAKNYATQERWNDVETTN